MSLQKIKLVTFDVTNTLLKFKLPAWQYYAIIAREHGFKGTDEDIKSRFENSFKIMWQKHPNFGRDTIHWENWWRRVVTMTLRDHLSADADLDGIANWLINYFRTDRCWRIACGSDKLIHQLRNLGISVGVISNFDPRLNDILNNVSLRNNFDFIITSYDVGYSKPHKKIFQRAIEKCRSPICPSEALHIGDDMKKDYEGARRAGWHALLVNEKLKASEKPPQEHVFSSLEDLNTTIVEKRLIL